ncbi:MAG: DUF4988 domain-containing protein, partial [Duncaniella sp.]|nr:DUF4988 domain-containing protein [Duncaniella sp.]
MNKKFINGLLLATLVVGSAGSFTSCKDYDDDIDNLQSQIDGINVTIGQLQELISSGKVIKDVTSNADGVVITMTDGKTYTITNGKNGTNGADGKNATVWTINSDGYWCEDGKVTEWKAVGTDGKNGTDGTNGTNGTDGTNGTNGQNGEYYVPNVETGCFDIYRDGEKIKSTDIKWRQEVAGSGITAVYSGTKLTFSGIKDSDGKDATVEIDLGTPVGSIAFIPEVMNTAVALPQPKDPFYHVNSYISDSKATPAGDFAYQTDWGKSNIVDLAYRINPSDAFVAENAQANFVNRSVQVVSSRAAGDAKTLLNVKSMVAANGELNVEATVNPKALNDAPEFNIAALQLWNGQAVTTSDYIYINSTAVAPILVDSAKMKANPTTGSAVVTFYNRTKVIASADKETSAFIQQFAPLAAAANAELVYNGELDLAKLPGLFVQSEWKYLADLGFTGMSYEFSLPKEYLSNETAVQGNQTNQQWFVQLDGTVLKVNETNVTGEKTQAIGRTPVVRVDAFLEGNDGVKRMVASAYIKVSIVAAASTPDEEKEDKVINLTSKEFEYHNLSDAAVEVNHIDWQTVNNDIYGAQGLTAATFWQNYGGAAKKYTVSVTTTDINGNIVNLIPAGTTDEAQADQTYNLAANGIFCTATLGSSNTQTSNVVFKVDNKVKTDLTYKNVDGKGAEYVVTITIPSNDKTKYPDYKIVQKFYVKSDCTGYAFNPNFYDNAQGCVITKGKIVNGTWALEMNISEVFAMVSGQNIYQYFNADAQHKNVTGIVFGIKTTSPAQTGLNLTALAN